MDKDRIYKLAAKRVKDKRTFMEKHGPGIHGAVKGMAAASPGAIFLVAPAGDKAGWWEQTGKLTKKLKVGRRGLVGAGLVSAGLLTGALPNPVSPVQQQKLK